jgi:hypothetical protein
VSELPRDLCTDSYRQEYLCRRCRQALTGISTLGLDTWIRRRTQFVILFFNYLVCSKTKTGLRKYPHHWPFLRQALLCNCLCIITWITGYEQGTPESSHFPFPSLISNSYQSNLEHNFRPRVGHTIARRVARWYGDFQERNFTWLIGYLTTLLYSALLLSAILSSSKISSRICRRTEVDGVICHGFWSPNMKVFGKTVKENNLMRQIIKKTKKVIIGPLLIILLLLLLLLLLLFNIWLELATEVFKSQTYYSNKWLTHIHKV